VNNGAFTLTEYTIGEGMVLEKNPEYWNADAVKIDVINAAFLDDANTAYAAYEAGDFDFIPSVPTAEIPRLIAEDPNFYVFPLLGTYYYNFNLDLPLWEDVRVRKALALGFDRTVITETLASGQVPAAGFVPPGFKDHEGRDFFETAGTFGLSIDDSGVEEAQQLLADAGYPGGEGFPEFVLLYNTSEGHQTVAELMQEMWKTNLGIDITLANQEWAVFQDTRKEGDYEMARGGWLTDFMDPSGMLAIFQDGNAYNDPNYFNEDFEAAMAAALSTTDKAEHFEKLYEAQEIFINDFAVIPVYHYSDTMLASERVVGWDRSVLGGLDFTTAEIVK
jgi:oligopeptide transport system substrate-binding protein